MARAEIALRKTDSILDELDELRRQLNERAYDLFCSRGGPFGDPVSDWLRAERELVWTPAVEVRQRDGRFEIVFAIPGVDVKDLDVRVTPVDILIRTSVDHEHTTQAGTVHVCEFARGRAFRCVHLPGRIDPDSVKAHYRNGLLHLSAAVAEEVAAGKSDARAA